MLSSKYHNKYKAQKTETEHLGPSPCLSRAVASLADFSLAGLELSGYLENLAQSHFLKIEERLLENFQINLKITEQVLTTKLEIHFVFIFTGDLLRMQNPEGLGRINHSVWSFQMPRARASWLCWVLLPCSSRPSSDWLLWCCWPGRQCWCCRKHSA